MLVKSVVVVLETDDEVVVVVFVVVETVGSSAFAAFSHFFETDSVVERFPLPWHSMK